METLKTDTRDKDLTKALKKWREGIRELDSAIQEDDLAQMVTEGLKVGTLALELSLMAYKQLEEKNNEE